MRISGMGWAPTLAVSLLIGLTGCAGTPWGETLSGSFPAPPEQGPTESEPLRKQEPASAAPSRTAAPVPPAAPPPATAPTGPRPVQGSPAPGSRPQGPATPAAAKTPVPTNRPTPLPSSPSPYRVTIRLPQADPSAPAEGVTEALRAAGIPFEVETIERVKGVSSQPGEPMPSPSPAAGSPSAVRPAPPPR